MATPWWRQVYNEWEKAVSPTLETVAQSDAFRDMISVSARASRGMLDQTEQVSRQVLHLFNLPAAGDIRRLRRQIASLDREVQSLRRELEAAEQPKKGKK